MIADILTSMTRSDSAISEQEILNACRQREVSLEEAFEALYKLYAPLVRGWILVSLRKGEAEDLFQDIWIVFYRRWQQWRFLPEMEDAEARPVASFLYRTFRFSLEGYNRRAGRHHESIEDVELRDDPDTADRLLEQIEFGRCLDMARKICSRQEMDVLLAKLAGIPARDIAVALSITEAVVDHGYRKAITKLQKRLKAMDLKTKKYSEDER